MEDNYYRVNTQSSTILFIKAEEIHGVFDDRHVRDSNCFRLYVYMCLVHRAHSMVLLGKTLQ